MGKSSTVTIGYREYMGLHMGFCYGPVDAILEVTGDDKTAWTGELTASGGINIQKPGLYGGEKKEGGLFGLLTVMMGEDTQLPSSYLSSVQSGPQPAYLGLCTATFQGMVGAITPYIKPIGVRVRRALKGWPNDDCWEPTLALVGRGMNAIHIIMQCYTDPRFGPVFTRDDIDLDNFKAAAQTIKDEDFGLCLGWRRSTPMATFVASVCDHIGAMTTEDPETLKQQIVLVRGGYDVDALVQVDESNILELTRFQQTLLADTVNQVTVKYHDIETDTDANTPPAQNLANIQAQGKVVDQSTEYSGFWKADQANRAAARDCHSKSCLPASVEIKVKSSLWRIKRGDVIAFSWARKGVVKMALRVLEVGRGDRPNSPLTLTCSQDVYGLPQTTYMSSQPTGWVPPDTAPHAITVERLIEVPYRDLAHRLRQADLNVLADDAGYLAAFAARPPGVNYNFGLVTRIGSDDFVDAGSGDFLPGGLLSAELPAGTGPDVITVTGPDALELITVGTAAMIDDEIVRLDAIDPVTGVLTIARGCADTVPADHALGARLWCYQDHAGYSATEYVGGETVDAKLLTRTSAGELDPAAATAISLTFDDRQIRPYPPGNLQINGVAYPIAVASDLVLTWSHRDRGLQADQLIDTAAANVGPETGTTYTVRTYLGGVLKSTTAGITGTTHTPADPGSGTVRIEVDAVRDGYTSWQPLTAMFKYGAPEITNTFVTFVAGVAKTYQLTEQFGMPPCTYSSGTLPAGITMDAAGLISYDGTGGEIATSSVSFIVTDANGSASTTSIPVTVSGARQYWRIYITANNGGATTTVVMELQFREAIGGASLCTGGSAFASSVFAGGYVAGLAFDGNTTTTAAPDCWASASGLAPPHSLGYALPAAKRVTEIAVWQRKLAGFAAYAVKDFVVQSSSDSTTGLDGTWVNEWSVTGQTAWADGELRVFARP